MIQYRKKKYIFHSELTSLKYRMREFIPSRIDDDTSKNVYAKIFFAFICKIYMHQSTETNVTTTKQSTQQKPLQKQQLVEWKTKKLIRFYLYNKNNKRKQITQNKSASFCCFVSQQIPIPMLKSAMSILPPVSLLSNFHKTCVQLESDAPLKIQRTKTQRIISKRNNC